MKGLLRAYAQLTPTSQQAASLQSQNGRLLTVVAYCKPTFSRAKPVPLPTGVTSGKSLAAAAAVAC